MEKVKELILKSKSAIILSHVNADGDAVASSMAMKCILKELGINSKIYLDAPVEERLSFITDEALVYAGEVCEHDLCIVLDSGSRDRLGRREEILKNENAVVNIDHHITNTMFGDANYVVPHASATGEVLFDVLEALGVELTQEIARYLYIALCSDTGCFAYSNASSKTFSIASKLVKKDIDHAEIARLLFNCVDIKSELIKAELVKSVNSYCDGKIRTVSVTREMAEKFGIDVEDVQGLVDIPRRFRGTEIAVALKEKEDTIRISLRAVGNIDVAKVAMQFGGGGHTKAAGCGIDKEIKEAERDIVKACEVLL